MVGQKVLLHTQVNGLDEVFSYTWAGNVPYGHEVITKAQALAYLNTRLAVFDGYVERALGNPASTLNDPHYSYSPDTRAAVAKDYADKAAYQASRLADINSVSEAPPPAPIQNTAAKAASTLFEWYTALGQALPSLDSRAVLYQNFNLGAASTYVGTAEQNNRLLVELKRAAGAL